MLMRVIGAGRSARLGRRLLAMDAPGDRMILDLDGVDGGITGALVVRLQPHMGKPGY